MNKNLLSLIVGTTSIVAAAGISFAQADAPSASMTVVPTVVNVAGSGSNEVFTITKKITGAGGSSATPMDVVFALDSSGSMRANDPGNQRISASQTFLGNMVLPPDRAGVVSWDSGIDFALPLTSISADVNTALTQVNSSGLTNLDTGLTKSLDLLAPFYPSSSPSRKCTVIFLTDGDGPYTPSGNSGSQADRAAGMDCTIYAIGYGQYAHMVPLKDMANATGGNYYPNPTYPTVDASTIHSIFQDIYQEINTIPYNVTVQETVQDYIEIISGSCNLVPDEGPVDGKVIWYDIGMFADGNSGLSASETVTLSCQAKCTQAGINQPVVIPAESYVTYEDNNGNNGGEIEIPQKFITCGGDFDEDGVNNSYDNCPNTLPTDIDIDANGCGLAQRECPCDAADSRTHDDYVRCITRLARRNFKGNKTRQARKDFIISHSDTECGLGTSAP